MERILLDKLSFIDHNLTTYDITDINIDTYTMIRPLIDENNANKIMSKYNYSLKMLFNSKNITIPNYTNTDKGNIMNMLLDLSFISFTICLWIEEKCNKIFKILYRNVILNIYIDNNENYDDIYLTIRKFVLIIEWLLSIINQQNRILNIHLFLSNCEKHISDDFLGFNEINSGVSYSGICSKQIHSGCNDGFIQIFRKEEMYKVLIHELIHNLGMDVNFYDFTNDVKHIHINKKSHKILVNEAYTELIALYLHSMIYSYVHNLSLRFILQNEKSFTEKQINKIFNATNVNHIRVFAKSNNFVQYTNVIPYFIIKYLFMRKMKQFINMFHDKENTIILIKELLETFYTLKIPKVHVNNSDTSLRMIYYNL